MNGTKPSRQVGRATAIGVPAGVIIAWAFGAAGVDVPAEVAAAFGGFLTGVLSWLFGPDA